MRRLIFPFVLALSVLLHAAAFASVSEDTVELLMGVLTGPAEKTQPPANTGPSDASYASLTHLFSGQSDDMKGTIQGNIPYNMASSPAYNSDLGKVKFSSLDSILDYMNDYFSYSFHEGTLPYSPDTLNAKRSGDCKDFAAFVGDRASQLGYTGNTVVYNYDSTKPNYGHAVNLINITDGLGNRALVLVSNGEMFGPVYDPVSLERYARAALGPTANEAVNFRYYPLGYTGRLL